MVDHALVRVSALDPGDRRSFDISVAGGAALLVAKLHKIAERQNDAARRQDKDGLDVLRLLRHEPVDRLIQTLVRLLKDPISQAATAQARGFLQDLFTDRAAPGAQMAIRASIGLEDADTIAVACEVLARQLLAAWSRG